MPDSPGDGLAAVDDRDVCACSADVERDEVQLVAE